MLMIEKLISPIYHSEKTLRRSIAKKINYRVIVVVLNFIAVYLFTGKLKTALGFTIVSIHQGA
jgi:hypothetical protein